MKKYRLTEYRDQNGGRWYGVERLLPLIGWIQVAAYKEREGAIRRCEHLKSKEER